MRGLARLFVLLNLNSYSRFVNLAIGTITALGGIASIFQFGL